MKRFARAFAASFVNAIAGALPDDLVSDRLRPILYRILGLRYGQRTVMKGGSRVNGFGLVLGSRVFINRACYFDLSAPIVIGDNVVVGHHVTFVTAHHDVGPPARRAGDVRPAPVTIGEGAWIGCRATILPGVTIGAGAVIGAGALVNRDVPPNTVAGGVPAKWIKDLPGQAPLSPSPIAEQRLDQPAQGVTATAV